MLARWKRREKVRERRAVFEEAGACGGMLADVPVYRVGEESPVDEPDDDG
jgi:hypothetical protein